MGRAQAINGRLRRLPVWPVYLAGLIPAAWLWTAALTGRLGVDPVKALEQGLGLHALQFLIASLAVTPLRRFTGVSLLRYRRALGLLAFAYVLQHLGVWLLFDIQLRWPEIWADILKRPYITVGMAGFLMLLPLALTSTDAAVRRLGAAAWTRLHRLAYPAALAGGAHFLMSVKAWPLEPILYMAAILALLALRLVPRSAGPRAAPGAGPALRR